MKQHEQRASTTIQREIVWAVGKTYFSSYGAIYATLKNR